MSNPTRSQWLGTLEIIATRRPDEAEAEWAWVMEQLGLGPEYFLGIHEAVRQGRWREAENPGAYLKTAARREQSRLTDGGERKLRGIRGIPGLEFAGEEITLGRDGWAGRSGGAPEAGERLTREEMLEHMEHRRSGGRAVRDPDGVWRGAGGHVPGMSESGEARRRAQQAAELDIALSRGMAQRRKRPARHDGSQPGPLDGYMKRIKEMQAARGQEEPQVDEEAPERLRGDWAQWAQAAGLSEWEKKVVEYKIRGVGWRQAIAEQVDDESRRALRAAWRKMERTGEARLRGNLGADEVGDRG